MSRLAWAVLATSAAALLAAPAAKAGSYTVYACDAASAGSNINYAWHPAASRGLSPAAHCPSNGDPFRGLTTRITSPVRNGSFERWQFYSPAGTEIDGIYWRGRWARDECYWKADMEAEPSGRVIIGRASAGGATRCAKGIPATSRPMYVAVPPGNNGLQQWVVCGWRTCAPGATFHSYYAAVVVRDPTVPAVGVTGGGLVSGRWVRRSQTIGFSASDNTGIRSAAVTVGSHPGGTYTAGCNYLLERPGIDRSGSVGFATDQLPDGIYPLRLDVADCARNSRLRTGTVKVDNTPPARVHISVAGGDGWRQRNAFTIRWSNAAERFAPILRARYRLCDKAGECSAHTATSLDIDHLSGLSLSRPGVHILTVATEDEAGNVAPVSDPVHLRFDPVAPTVYFDPQSESDPLRVSVSVSDDTSGVAGGEIEMRARGSRTWHELEAGVEGSKLIAYVDDERFREGAYEFRARAVDRAGNERTTDARADGSLATMELPVRFATRLRVGIRRMTTSRRIVRRHGTRRLVKRRIVRYVGRGRVALDHHQVLRGRLTNPDGQPIDGGTIDVLGRPRYGSANFTALGQARTNADGRFRYIARGTYSRVLRFRYAGTRRIRPATRDVALLVPASSTIRVSRGSVLNGGTVFFRGRLRGGHIPAEGKLAYVQAILRGRWRTFATPRADRRGRWRLPYRFMATAGDVRYRFRLCVPHDTGYPFETGCSRSVTVRVRGP